jgi:ubiquinone biosynthesis protein
LAADLTHLLAGYVDRPLGEVQVGPLIAEVQAVARRHQLQLPANLALLLKTVGMSEGLGAQLDPGFALGRVLAPYTEQLLLRQFAPARLARRVRDAGIDVSRLALDLPRQVRRLTRDLDRGGPTVGVRPEGFEPLLGRVERLTNRLVLGIIAAAFINGLAVLMTVYHPRGWNQWAGAVFGVGFLTAVGLGLYLAWSIVRSGRR